ncbi:hypothetical protein Zmor_005428 [Zophobas morio]|uniref:Uncharacterized protein n=1 Tax=Zophobas morio TaxID=2755281 RepID=A0AA38IPX9_9CUCU|nr:hypothetical protein Zmor_005428 [Zophobas morio]
MNFRPQVESLRGRVIGMMGELRRVLRKEWSLDKRTVRVIYKGLVVACASFGVGVWCDVLRFQNTRELVNRCQRRVLYRCMVFCRTVSMHAMQVLMGELPWDLAFLRRGVMFRAKRGDDFVPSVRFVSENIWFESGMGYFC